MKPVTRCRAIIESGTSIVMNITKPTIFAGSLSRLIRKPLKLPKTNKAPNVSICAL